LFSTLAYAEETRTLDVSDENDQEVIIRNYLSATGYGSAEEIEEEIEVWKDLGKLEQQAHKFKPKLDKMQEQIVARKLQEQEMRRRQQEQASQQYMQNVYETLKDGSLGDVKIDRKTQNLLYNGLVQPNYPSVSGRNTNLLGHLLEKYQFVEPNYTLISEALWLLSDPDGYKAKIMEKGAQKTVESTVRKLKMEQANNNGSSLGVDNVDDSDRNITKRKIQRPNNIFKRF
jgi:nitroimidazol reductase NimA-like FMN-containing flavoprotein (pyridoxamine 5'-phosphate oxidase superfamily)